MTVRPDFPIEETTYDDVMARFGRLYRQAKLPTKPTANARWFASEVSAAALVHVTAEVARVKATAVEPEWRGLGYGEEMLVRLCQEAVAAGHTTGEAFTKGVDDTPGSNAGAKWYRRHGWRQVGERKGGIVVVRGDLAATLRDYPGIPGP